MTLGRRLFKLPNNMGTLEVRSSSFSAFLAFWIIILRMVIAIGVLNRILNIPESSSNILNGHQLYLTTTALRLFPIIYGRELCWRLVTICFMAAVIQASWIMVVEKLVGRDCFVGKGESKGKILMKREISLKLSWINLMLMIRSVH